MSTITYAGTSRIRFVGSSLRDLSAAPSRLGFGSP